LVVEQKLFLSPKELIKMTSLQRLVILFQKAVHYHSK
jgi:hypothetical protein